MCGAQRSLRFNFNGSGPERSANSINRDAVGKRKLFFHSWWQRGKPFLPYGKDSSMQKRRMRTIHTFRVATRGLDDAAFHREDGRPMKILCLFFALCSVALAAEPGSTVFING